jgi:hypothetical protein
VRTLCISVLFLIGSSLASACSCSNSTPIERTQTTRYGEGAVFTARVVQAIGGYSIDGRRSSTRVIAVVQRRYWGLPSYWPNIVILDSGFLCNFGMYEEEYLVSGRRIRYGVLDVGWCSRTQPLASAQVDLRTLDGALCTGAGGTLIGRVSMGGYASYNSGNPRDLSPVRNAVLTFRDFYGKPYVVQSDSEGIYELRHVPPGPYSLDSSLGADKYAIGGGEVRSGVCQESPVEVSTYNVSGRLAPGINGDARVELVGPDGGKLSIAAQEGFRGLSRGRVAHDGRFYFEAVPPGEYTLAASFYVDGQVGGEAKVYFPGTSRPEKAIRIRVPEQTRGQSFDFDPNSLPLVSIPFFFESPTTSRPTRIHVQVLNASGMDIAGFLSVTGIPISVAAVRGGSYKISAQAYSDDNNSEPDRQSETVQVTAAGEMAITHIAFRAAH